jgi:hypothetical protein
VPATLTLLRDSIAAAVKTAIGGTTAIEVAITSIVDVATGVVIYGAPVSSRRVQTLAEVVLPKPSPELLSDNYSGTSPKLRHLQVAGSSGVKVNYNVLAPASVPVASVTTAVAPGSSAATTTFQNNIVANIQTNAANPTYNAGNPAISTGFGGMAAVAIAPPAASASTASSSPPPVGAIAGGVVGGVVGLIIVLGGACFLFKGKASGKVAIVPHSEESVGDPTTKLTVRTPSAKSPRVKPA